jgi:LysM repeat protein
MGDIKNNINLGDYFYHVSSGGDTLQTASNLYKVPLETLKKLNNKSENEPLQAGEKIKIPSL